MNLHEGSGGVGVTDGGASAGLLDSQLKSWEPTLGISVLICEMGTTWDTESCDTVPGALKKKSDPLRYLLLTGTSDGLTDAHKQGISRSLARLVLCSRRASPGTWRPALPGAAVRGPPAPPRGGRRPSLSPSRSTGEASAWAWRPGNLLVCTGWPAEAAWAGTPTSLAAGDGRAPLSPQGGAELCRRSLGRFQAPPSASSGDPGPSDPDPELR